METTIRLKVSELPNLTKVVNSLFSKDDTIEITVSESKVKNLSKKETKAHARLRIRQALDDANKRRNLIVFTPKEFDAFSETFAASFKR